MSSRSAVDDLRSTARVVLASASPRRRDLLTEAGVAFVVAPTNIDESELAGEQPVPYVLRVAAAKAAAAGREPGDVVIAADTTVDVDGEIFAKPVDADDARRMLRRLSGRTHRVHTAVAVERDELAVVDVATTMVTMTSISDAALAWYVGTGEPLDKAGAYAIQGHGGTLVERTQGSMSNVVGLPMTLLDQLLQRVGLSLAALRTPD